VAYDNSFTVAVSSPEDKKRSLVICSLGRFTALIFCPLFPKLYRQYVMIPVFRERGDS